MGFFSALSKGIGSAVGKMSFEYYQGLRRYLHNSGNMSLNTRSKVKMDITMHKEQQLSS